MFGLCFHRRAARRQKSTHAVPRLRFESLEARRLLATDIDVVQVSGITDGAVVAYEIHEEAAANFEITAYESKDGVELGGVLDSVRVDEALAREVGEHVAALDWESHHVTEDHVVIVVDSASEVAETDEGNNYASFELPTAQDPSLEIVSVTENSSDQTLLHLNVNRVAVVNIDWGDGNSELLSDFDDKIIANHAYSDSGSYAVTVHAIDHDGQEVSESATVIAIGQKPVIQQLDVSYDKARAQWIITGNVTDNGPIDGLQVTIEVNGEEFFAGTDEFGNFIIRLTNAPRDVTAKVMDADDWWSDVVRWGRP